MGLHPNKGAAEPRVFTVGIGKCLMDMHKPDASVGPFGSQSTNAHQGAHKEEKVALNKGGKSRWTAMHISDMLSTLLTDCSALK